MSTEAHRRDGDDNSIDRRVDRLDTKIDRVGDQVSNLGKEMRSALEMMMTQQTDRWNWFEQRTEIEGRNSKQAIELLTSSMVKVQQEISSTETQLAMIEKDQSVGTAKLVQQKITADVIHDEFQRRIDLIDGRLQWVTRTIAASLITAALAILVAAYSGHI